MSKEHSSRAERVTMFGVIILILVVVFVILKPAQEGKEEVSPRSEEKLESSEKISSQEKELIETWLRENDLNQYGDPKDTVYIGGTPLFNEGTGERIDRYEYILERHPNRPWRE